MCVCVCVLVSVPQSTAADLPSFLSLSLEWRIRTKQNFRHIIQTATMLRTMGRRSVWNVFLCSTIAVRSTTSRNIRGTDFLVVSSHRAYQHTNTYRKKQEENTRKETPTEAQKLFIEAQEAFKNNEIQTSIQKYTQLLNMVQSTEEYNTYEVFSFLHMARAEAYKRGNEFNKAILDLSEVIEKYNRLEQKQNMDLVASAYLARGKLYVMRNELSAASTDLDMVERITKEYADKIPIDHSDTLNHQLKGLRRMIEEAQSNNNNNES
jgi:tetratricopeptide (TPR) repeat protein